MMTMSYIVSQEQIKRKSEKSETTASESTPWNPHLKG